MHRSPTATPRIRSPRSLRRAPADTAEPVEQHQEAPLPVGGTAAFDADLRHRMISEAAYYRYLDRGYEEGYDVDDWLEAEAAIDDLIANPDSEPDSDETAALASP